jgi:septal ring factor EnvC (AmiA/AmiB activator)
MDGDTTRPGRISAFFDASAERIGELCLVFVLASVKAWNAYQERRDHKRAGRRATDQDYTAVKKAIARIEEIQAQLLTGLTRLTSRVSAIERKRPPKDE